MLSALPLIAALFTPTANAASESPETQKILLGYVLFVEREPATPYRQTVEHVLATTANAPALVDELPQAPGELVVTLFADIDQPPPPKDYLRMLSRGLDDAEIERVAKAGDSIGFAFVHGGDEPVARLRRADAAVLAVADALDAWIFDPEARLIYSRAAFRKQRLDVPTSVAGQVAVHQYETDDGRVRVVTLGMSKFGQPDLVVERTTWFAAGWMELVELATAQLMIEGRRPDASGAFRLSLDEVRAKEVRDRVTSDLREGARREGTLSLRTASLQEGDADNALLEISFDRFAGVDKLAQQSDGLKVVFGWNEAMVELEPDAELEAASATARKGLPALRDAFNAGLEPGEFVMVKSPFAKDEGTDGKEWMWVEVTSWKGDAIYGVLRNEPFYIAKLHVGQRVQVSMAEVFDWMRIQPDGTQTGGTTNAVIERMEGTSVRTNGSEE